MHRIHSYIAKSAKLKLAVALLAMFALTAGGLAALAKQNTLAISVFPATRTFTQGQAQTVSFALTVSNSQGAPALEATGIPAGVTATWSAGSAGSPPPGQAKKCTAPCTTVNGDGTVTLTLSLPYDLAVGSYPIGVKVTAPNNSTATATATIVSSAPPQFTISGDAAGPLTRLSGGAQTLNVSVYNPYDHELKITNLYVVPSTTQPGCDARQFQINQVATNQAYTVPANRTTQLTGPLPSVSWPDDPNHPQNACIGARITFTFSADGQS